MPASHARKAPAKSERTRAAILAAAEGLFAHHGYAVTRLEDVAQAVGVKRAALFYYYPDKQALFEAVMENAFAELVARLDNALLGPSSIGERLEQAVEAWVDTIAARPTLARLILRHVTESEEARAKSLFVASERLLRTGWALFEAGRSSGELKPLHDDPFHSASAMIGATVFYVSAMASLLPAGGFDPLTPEHVAAHKRDALRTARHLFGIRSRRRGR